MNNWRDYLDPDNLSNLVSKVQSVVYNYTEYQAKVIEATNSDHWGASSTLMQDIAQGTHNPMHFMDIMDTIYKKLQERGSNWRQCYKALQLLEYLIKNGSERVVDSAKDHIYELKALKNFNYVDEKIKDQGLNVRNRAKEITLLLADNNKIREERKKAKENRAKYTGVASNSFSTQGMAFGGGSSSTYSGNPSSRYGGFGSDSFRSNGGFRDEDSSSKYDSPVTSPSKNYDESPTTKSSSYDPPVESSSSGGKFKIVMKGDNSSGSPSSKAAPAPAPQIDLLDMGDDGFTSSAGNTAAPAGGADDDEWGDFASVPAAQTTSTTSKASPLDDFSSFAASVPSAGSVQQPANNGFAAFGQPNIINNNNGSNGFTNFKGNQSSPLSPQTANGGGFGNFSQPQQQPMNTGMAPNYGAFTAATQQQSILQPQQSQPLTPSSTAGAKPADPFSKLVSLDAMSLTASGKKPAAVGASLNTISAQKPINVPVAGAGAMMGMGMQQQQQQPQQFGGLGFNNNTNGNMNNNATKPNKPSADLLDLL